LQPALPYRQGFILDIGFQVGGQIGRAGVTQFRLFLNALQADQFQVGINLRVEHSRADRILIQDEE